jgi:predicted amidohydrolase
MATCNAARLLGRSDELGLLDIGSAAEISVLRVEEREWNAVDSQKGTIPAHQAIIPVLTVRGEAIFEPLPTERP